MIAAFAGSAEPVEATTIDVSSAAALQSALDTAGPGGTIRIAAGTYVLPATITVPEGVTISGAGRDAVSGTVLQRTGTAAMVIEGNGVTLKDLRVVKTGSVDTSGNLAIDIGSNSHMSISDLTMSGIAVAGGSQGVRVRSQMTVIDWTITDSEFTGNAIGIYAALEQAGNDTTVTGFTAIDVVFRDNLRKGCYFEKLEHARLERILIEDSGTEATHNFNAGCDINLKWQAFEDIDLRDITIVGSGLPSTAPATQGAALTIKARDDGNYAASPATLSGVTISNLEVTGGQTALRIGETGKGNDGPAGLTITGSRATETTTGVFIDNQADAPVVAAGNWWGQPGGPDAGQVVGAVTVGSWCLDAVCSATSDDASLTALSLDEASLSPTFAPGTTSYTATVANAVNAVTVRPTAAPGATTVVAGAVLNQIGANPVTVTVTSADGSRQTVYAISVVRGAPPELPVTVPPTTIPPPPTSVPPPITVGSPVIARPPADPPPPPPPPPPSVPQVVAGVTTPSGAGTIHVTPEGRIVSTGDAPDLGGVDTPLNAPVTGLALTPSGNGYWVVAADGGVFCFGDAPFLGSTGGTELNAPITGLAPNPAGDGYVTVAADGGIFTFGGAPFLGSMAGVALNAPVTAVTFTPSGAGYVLVGKDGGIFTFGDASFHGSAAGIKPDVPARSATMTSTGQGYWITFDDGTILAFGDAELSE